MLEQRENTFAVKTLRIRVEFELSLFPQSEIWNHRQAIDDLIRIDAVSASVRLHFHDINCCFAVSWTLETLSRE